MPRRHPSSFKGILHTFDFGRSQLRVMVGSGTVNWVMVGDTRRVSPGERERAAYILQKWVGGTHDECYQKLWCNIPSAFDGVES